MSDEITKPHFIRANDEPQQIVKTELVTPGKMKGRHVKGFPVITVRDHPGILPLKPKPAPQQNGTGKEQPAMDGLAQEAMKKPVQSNDTTKE